MRKERGWEWFSEDRRWKPVNVLKTETSRNERKLSFPISKVDWIQPSIELAKDSKLEISIGRNKLFRLRICFDCINLELGKQTEFSVYKERDFVYERRRSSCINISTLKSNETIPWYWNRVSQKVAAYLNGPQIEALVAKTNHYVNQSFTIIRSHKQISIVLKCFSKYISLAEKYS